MAREPVDPLPAEHRVPGQLPFYQQVKTTTDAEESQGEARPENTDGTEVRSDGAQNERDIPQVTSCQQAFLEHNLL